MYNINLKVLDLIILSKYFILTTSYLKLKEKQQTQNHQTDFTASIPGIQFFSGSLWWRQIDGSSSC